MKRRHVLAAASAAGLVLSSGLALEPAAATEQARTVHVRFVLEPSWLPAGYSANGGGWVVPSGGLHVYPKTGVTASGISVGSDQQQDTQQTYRCSSLSVITAFTIPNRRASVSSRPSRFRRRRTVTGKEL
jgi:hypothetical protein